MTSFAGSDRWLNEQRLARQLFSEVSVEVAADGCAIIYGVFYCERRFLKLGPFFIKILYPPTFPDVDPNFYLLNFESWRKALHHIEPDGRFCWVESKDSPINFDKLDSLKLLAENIAFRLVQVEMVTRMAEEKKKWPGPDRSHEWKGITEAKIERKRLGIGPNTRPCICGKDVKYKKCHGKREVFNRGVTDAGIS